MIHNLMELTEDQINLLIEAVLEKMGGDGEANDDGYKDDVK